MNRDNISLSLSLALVSNVYRSVLSPVIDSPRRRVAARLFRMRAGHAMPKSNLTLHPTSREFRY